MPDRSHLSIGEVLSLLQDDFPDVTISKIRFLESQGLLDPERTPSGYRKFYEADIERLRWILRHQRDHFLPLKVMKDRLEESAKAGLMVPPDEPAGPSPAPSLFEEGGEPAPAAPAAAPPAASPTASAPIASAPIAPAPPTPAPTAPVAPEPPADRPDRRAAAAAAATLIEAPASVAPRPAPEPVNRPTRAAPSLPPLPTAGAAGNPLDAGPSGVSLTVEELAEASGLTLRGLGDLGRFGLLTGYQVGGDTFYDGDALVVARTAAGFMRFGIEARHLRMYKVAAEREAGFMEQVVMPLLKQRNPTARQQAAENLGEMARLGELLRTALLRAALRDHTEPR
jgi:DNA-binding transcriptional MerR regulator